MTGYGKATGNHNDKKILVEIKSLNGKNVDVRQKLAAYFKEKELYIRNLVIEHAKRGKIECNVQIESNGTSEEYGLNLPLVKKYINELSSLQADTSISNHDWISAIFRIPNVIQTIEDEISEDEWNAVQAVLIQALESLHDFRAQEGEALREDLKNRVESIQSALKKVERYEQQRIIAVRERLRRNLEEFMGKDSVDKNRYEQEVIYYMEKLDINEEKVRLSQHCDFFLKELDSTEETSGRKLSFISQEMGREINTLGAKAQHSEIQQLVVSMKDSLEKIKEQLANVL